MDLALYTRVLWRFKYIVVVGLILAIGLALLSVKKVSFSGGSLSLSPRKAQIWKTDSFLLVTQPNFPWGRTVPQYAPGSPTTGAPATAQGDPARMASLTAIYSNPAVGLNDWVQAKIGLSGPHPPQGSVTVAAVPAPPYSNPAILPILDFSGTGPTPAASAVLARSASSAFAAWLSKEQSSAHTAPGDRVQLRPVTKESPAVLISHSGKTLPVIVFLTIIGATVGLALVLENVRPRPAPALRAETAPPPARQSA